MATLKVSKIDEKLYFLCFDKNVIYSYVFFLLENESADV